jgi:hypothetical protein
MPQQKIAGSSVVISTVSSVVIVAMTGKMQEGFSTR